MAESSKNSTKSEMAAPWIPRFHLFEICDESWFPSYLRARVQSCLTVTWRICLPVIQSASPAQRVASLLLTYLGDTISQYTFVDFCAGAGGPTPTIERLLNAQLGSPQRMDQKDTPEAVKFLMTDIAPHIEEWERASKKSDNLDFIPHPVDASDAPTALIKDRAGRHKKVFRLFSLAFHHFDDPLATKILQNTLETSDGFGIFELQARDLPSFITVTLLWPLWMIMTPIFFWNDPWHLLFTYLIPIVPFVVVFDGYVSCLRVRTLEEVLDLVDGRNGIPGWEIKSGWEMHTFGIGYMRWIIGTRIQH